MKPVPNPSSVAIVTTASFVDSNMDEAFLCDVAEVTRKEARSEGAGDDERVCAVATPAANINAVAMIAFTISVSKTSYTISPHIGCRKDRVDTRCDGECAAEVVRKIVLSAKPKE